MKEIIIKVLQEVKGNIQIDIKDNLITNLGIDSHDIFNIVVKLEEAFDIEIEPIYLRVSNFSSVEKLEEMIKQIKGL